MVLRIIPGSVSVKRSYITELRIGFNGLLSTIDSFIVMVAGKNTTKTLSQSQQYGLLFELSEIRKDKQDDNAFKSALLKLINKGIDNTNYLRKALKSNNTGGANGTSVSDPSLM